MYNGFASWIALVCFGLALQMISLFSVYAMQSANLVKADTQSTFDLSCISHMKEMASHNAWIRRCHMEASELIVSKDIMMADLSVHFQDYETYIECTYQYQERDITMVLYYDDKNIHGIDFK